MTTPGSQSGQYRSPVAPPGPPADPDDPRGDLRWGTVPALVADAARRFGDADALAVTKAALAAQWSVGDRVGLWAPNYAEWVTAALGLLGAGLALVPVNTRFKGPEAADVLRRSQAKALFSVRGFLGTDYPELLGGENLPDLEQVVVLRGESRPGHVDLVRRQVAVTSLGDFVATGDEVSDDRARSRWEDVGPDDLSDVIFTSGTTGRPKGVTATHAQTVRTFATWANVVGLRSGDRYLIVNPFFHTFGYKAGIVACLVAGACIVPMAVFDTAAVAATVAAEHISVLPGPPTLYQSLLDDPRSASWDLSSLRLAVTGAAVVPVELVEALRALGLETVLTAYGLTESTGTVTMCRRGDPADTIAGTSGRAIPGVEVRVVSDDRTPLPAGEPGEVVVRGYTVTAGYLGDPDATAETIDGDGWLHTGDIGVLDEAGNLTITDRKKDMFIVGGFNAYPAEIERVLAGHPSVSQVAVIGVPDERMGEVGCAYVVPKPDAAAGQLPEELVGWAKDRLANYKVPRTVRVVDALPLNAAGKVQKTELRAAWSAS